MLPDEGWAAFGERLTALAEMTLTAGLRLVYHHHMGTIVESEAEIDRLMAVTGEPAHLLLDTGHATFAGADPVALARRHRARISHFHAKDIRPEVMRRVKAERLSFLDASSKGCSPSRAMAASTIPLSWRSCRAIRAGRWWKRSRTRPRLTR